MLTDETVSDSPMLVLTLLNREWASMITTSRHDELVRSWGRRQEALSALVDLRALDALHREWAVTDEMLLALLEEHHKGDALAGRVVLQLLLPGLIRISRGRRPSGCFGITVSCAWIRIAQYPTGRCRKGVAGRILLDVLHDITQSARRSGSAGGFREVSLYDEATAADSRGVDPFDRPVEAQVEDPASPLHEALNVLLWARERGVLSPADTMLLAETYIETDGGPEHNLRLAAKYDVSIATLRTRQSRAVRRLAAAVRDNPEAVRRAAPLTRAA